MHSMESLLLKLHYRISGGLRLCLFGLGFHHLLLLEIPEWKPCDEESDWDGEKDHVCFSLFRNQARQRHSIALQPDVCQPFVIWPQFVICCLWFCNTIRICNLWFCALYCNQNSLLTFRYRRIRMYMALREEVNRKKTFSFGHCPNYLTPPHDPNSGNLVLFFRKSKFKIWKSV